MGFTAKRSFVQLARSVCARAPESVGDSANILGKWGPMNERHARHLLMHTRLDIWRPKRLLPSSVGDESLIMCTNVMLTTKDSSPPTASLPPPSADIPSAGGNSPRVLEGASSEPEYASVPDVCVEQV